LPSQWLVEAKNLHQLHHYALNTTNAQDK